MADKAGPQPFSVTRLDKALHDRSAFSCGFAAMDRYLRTGVTQDIRRKFVTCFVALSESRVIGYYTLSSLHVLPVHDPGAKRTPPTIPATYIKAVAVDKNFQGRGIGTAMMIDAFRRALQASAIVASHMIILDVLQHGETGRRAEFYERMGFKALKDPENPHRMYLRLKDIRASLEI